MSDRIETVHNSIVQHGSLNRRIYLMKLDRRDLPRIFASLRQLARSQGYEKILAKVPASLAAAFRQNGYDFEAFIPGFFRSGEAVFFLARFLSAERAVERHPRTLLRRFKLVNTAAARSAKVHTARALPEACRKADAAEMSRVYRRVFETYPFPIHDPVYLADGMARNLRYFCIRQRGRIVALGGCEMDRGHGNVEMTDFAVLPEQRGRGLARRLLVRMEQAMAAAGMHTAYTISRTAAPAINITFRKCGYRFGGKLTNNSNISGSIQSMWVWHKPLTEGPQDAEGFGRAGIH
jgi:putative beta-lysine N-acetyltransferase